jgi:hypothetical protein
VSCVRCSLAVNNIYSSVIHVIYAVDSLPTYIHMYSGSMPRTGLGACQVTAKVDCQRNRRLLERRHSSTTPRNGYDSSNTAHSELESGQFMALNRLFRSHGEASRNISNVGASQSIKTRAIFIRYPAPFEPLALLYQTYPQATGRESLRGPG